jgi:alanine dehydrogenase
MIVGVPKEIKADEYRVAMLPVGAEELTAAGHTVLIEAGAGQGSGITDSQYAAVGAVIVDSPEPIWARAELVVKVKEPQPSEWPRLRRGQVVFTYFHFAADEALTHATIESGITAIAYETLRDARGNLPLLTPMSEVAGRMSIQEGAKYLEPAGGAGYSAGGCAGRRPGRGGHPGRWRRRLERRQGRRRARRGRPHPRRQSRPPPLPRRHHAP